MDIDDYTKFLNDFRPEISEILNTYTILKEDVEKGKRHNCLYYTFRIWDYLGDYNLNDEHKIKMYYPEMDLLISLGEIEDLYREKKFQTIVFNFSNSHTIFKVEYELDDNGKYDIDAVDNLIMKCLTKIENSSIMGVVW